MTMPVQLNSNSDGEGDEARIEIIPLIDIMFFLLASFMLVSLTMTQLHRVPIDLPEASTGVPDSKGRRSRSPSIRTASPRGTEKSSPCRKSPPASKRKQPRRIPRAHLR